MSLSPTMGMFGTAINYEFGDVEETGILIAVDEILEDKRMRHIQTFIESHPDALKMPCESEGVFTPKVVTPQEGSCKKYSGKDRVRRHRSFQIYNQVPPVFFRRVRAILYCIGRNRGC